MKLLISLLALFPLATSTSSHTRQLPEEITQSSAAINYKTPTQRPHDQEPSERASQTFPTLHSTPNYDTTGISPWNDNSRSETLDHITTWINCPGRYLNCRKCPRDRRCRRPSYLKPSLSANPAITQPSSKPAIPILHPHIAPPGPGDPAALTGPQLAHSSDDEDYDEGDKDCKLKRCGGRLNQCGSGATCVGGYCACPSGLKGGSGNVGRGWDVPEAATVYVDVGVACDQACEEFLCTEVWGLEGCFQDGKTGQEGKNEVDTTNSKGHGAIQMPGAGRVEGGDSFAGLSVVMGDDGGII